MQIFKLKNFNWLYSYEHYQILVFPLFTTYNNIPFSILSTASDCIIFKGAFYASVRGSLKLRPCRKSRKLPRVSLSATRWMWHPHGESIDTYLRSLTLSNVKSIIVCGSLLSVVTHCGGIRADTVAKVISNVANCLNLKNTCS